MKLLLDEHVSPRVSDALRANGHDVEAVSEISLVRGRSDDDVLSYAAREKRAVVTHNFADFLAIAADWEAAERDHWGLVLVPTRFQRRGVGAYLAACEAVLAAYPEADGLRGRVIWAESIQ